MHSTPVEQFETSNRGLPAILGQLSTEIFRSGFFTNPTTLCNLLGNYNFALHKSFYCFSRFLPLLIINHLGFPVRMYALAVDFCICWNSEGTNWTVAIQIRGYFREINGLEVRSSLIFPCWRGWRKEVIVFVETLQNQKKILQ